MDPECGPRLSHRAAFRKFQFRITYRTGATPLRRQATCYSVISSFLYQVHSWVPVHVSAGDGLNSWPGDKLQQGATDLVPDNLSMTVSTGCFSYSARFKFPTTMKFAGAIRLLSCDAKAVPPIGASPQPGRSFSFSDSSRPVFGTPLENEDRNVHAPSWPDTALCAIAEDLAG